MKSTSASRWGMICTGADDDDRDMVAVVMGCGRAMHPSYVPAIRPNTHMGSALARHCANTTTVYSMGKRKGKGGKWVQKVLRGSDVGSQQNIAAQQSKLYRKNCGECCYCTVRTLYSVFPARRILFSKASRSCFSSWAAGKAHQEKGP